jgi:hypothetical protein
MEAGTRSPNIRTLQATIAAAGAGAAQDQVIDEAPFAGTVVAVRLIPEANLTADNTNYRTFRVMNKGQAGTGNTVIASLATTVTATGGETAFDEKVIPLSVVAGATAVAAGDVLAVDETVTGTGVAHSGYRIEVDISRS